MQTNVRDVVVVVAGVAGSFLAGRLRNSGRKVTVVEQSKKSPIINRDDQVAPCTVRRLADIGALANFEKRGSIKIRRWRALGPDGEVVTITAIWNWWTRNCTPTRS